MQLTDTRLRYRFKQLTRHGMWTSDSVFEGSHDDVVREVLDGHVMGQARAAVDEASGRVIYAVDARGFCNATAIALFEGAGTRIGGSTADHPERSRRRCDAVLHH